MYEQKVKTDKLHVVSVDLKYRRPGVTLILFKVRYPDLGYMHKGTIQYDNITSKFITHTGNIKLLSAVCVHLRNPSPRITI